MVLSKKNRANDGGVQRATGNGQRGMADWPVDYYNWRWRQLTRWQDESNGHQWWVW
jgi:hypothetical protein